MTALSGERPQDDAAAAVTIGGTPASALDAGARRGLGLAFVPRIASARRGARHVARGEHL
jgi:hypothetical protein